MVNNDYNFNRLRVSGLKEFSQGSGSTAFKMIGGKLWGGSDTYSSGIFKLDLSAKTIEMTGTLQTSSGAGRILIDSSTNSIKFYNDSNALAATLYNYTVTGGSGKSVGLDAASTSGEVKLSCGLETRLVAKTYSSRPVLEFYGTQRIYCDTSSQLIFDSALVPLNNNSVDLGTSSKKWKAIYLKEGIDIDGHSGVSEDYDIETPSGTKTFTFTGGILTNVD